VAAGTKLFLNASYWWGQIRRSRWGQFKLTNPIRATNLSLDVFNCSLGLADQLRSCVTVRAKWVE
jgi:hypothetical protein